MPENKTSGKNKGSGDQVKAAPPKTTAGKSDAGKNKGNAGQSSKPSTKSSNAPAKNPSVEPKPEVAVTGSKEGKRKNSAPVKQNSQEQQPLEDQIKLEVTPGSDPVPLILSAIEKKMQALEKRKKKLEEQKAELKKLEKDGKKSQEEQVKGASKLSGVIGNMELLKQFSKEITKIVEDTAKLREEQEKEEAKKRRADARNKLKTMLIVQDVLTNIGDNAAKESLKKGIPGKLKPIKDNTIKNYDAFYESVFPDRKKAEPFDRQLNVAVDKFSWLLEGSKKGAMKGVHFVEMRESLLKIHESGLLGGQSEVTSQAENKEQSQANGTEAVSGADQHEIPHEEHQHPAQQQIHPQQQQQPSSQSVYSFGTVAGVETRPDQDPAVVSIMNSFPGTNEGIHTQVFTNTSFAPPGMYVPVTGVPPGAHMLPTPGQYVSPQHFQQQPPLMSGSNNQEGMTLVDEGHLNNNFDHQGDQINNNLQNLKLTDGQTQVHGDNEFRVKDHKRNKFNLQGNRRDNDRPARDFDRHGSSTGFQRKTDRYQGNRGDRQGNEGGRKPFRGPGEGSRGGYYHGNKPGNTGARQTNAVNGQVRGPGNFSGNRQQQPAGQQQSWS